MRKKKFSKIISFLISIRLAIAVIFPQVVLAFDNNEEQLYELKIEEVENGNLYFVDSDDKGERIRKFKQGEEVKIAYHQDEGYELDEVVFIANGEEKELNGVDGIYTIEMPSENVSIRAKFSKALVVNEDGFIHITKDFDYSKLDRRPWKEIDWSKYGGNGIKDPAYLEYLNSIGINPLEDENYGSKLEIIDKKILEEQRKKDHSIDTFSLDSWYVGKKISGWCDIQSVRFDPVTRQSYFKLYNFTGGLAGLEQVGEGWCMDHTAAEPPPGHPITDVVATVTSIDSTNGIVYFSLVITPWAVTDGVTSNENGLLGYQHVGANAKLDLSGQLQIIKESADPSITNGNNYYSLADAQYSIYTNSSATGTPVKVVTMDSNGWSAPVTLAPRRYYIKETKAPPGYALDGTIYPVDVNTGIVPVRKTLKDRPQTDPINILLRKVDADTGQNIPVGDGSLQDAHFTFKFYGGEYAEGVDPATLGKSPNRTWVMRTDSDGFVLFLDTYKVSGDQFWYNSYGFPTMPLGTVTIQETKAPNGYKLDETVHVRRTRPNGVTDDINSYNTPIIKEDSLDLIIRKVQKGTDILLENIKFKHTKPDGSLSELTTNSNGEIAIKGLAKGVHKIVEVQTIPGFVLNPNEFVFEVTSDNKIKVITNTTGLGIDYTEFEGNGVVTFENDLKPFKIKAVKINDKETLLKDAEFTLYEDRECKKEISKAVSNDKGELMFEGLKVGVPYYFKETKAPPGYRIPIDENGNPHIYKITTESQPSNNIFDFIVDGIKYNVNSTSGPIRLEGTEDDRVVAIEVVNYIGMKLPTTGSNMMLPMLIAGVSFMLVAFALSKRFNKKKENNRGK